MRPVFVVFILIAAAVSAVLTMRMLDPPQPAPSDRLVDPPVLRAPSADRRLVIVLADNAGTETTDLLVPHGILRRSGAVDVVIVATGPGPVRLMPALTVVADMTVAEFARAHPGGADAVVVPALHSRGTEATAAFLAQQAALGALVVAICEGAEVVARAGLLDGRTATTHWFAQRRVQRRHPAVHWVDDIRYVVDGPVISSSGVSASVPVTLALLELLAGHGTARRTAAMLGLADWTADHDSAPFALDAAMLATTIGNGLRFWRHERLSATVADGFDGVAFALQADAWSRTYRSRLQAHGEGGSVTSAEGVVYLTEPAVETGPSLAAASGPPLAVLEASLAAIADRYDPRTAVLVAKQLEYPWSALSDR